MASFQETLTEAMREMADTGYVSEERVAYWQRRLREAAEAMMASDVQVEQMLRDGLRTIYERELASGIYRHNPGLSRFTIDQIKPKLRPELDRRIQASIDLIKLNRPQSVDLMIRRFVGWSTSIPAGGSNQTERQKEKARIKGPLKDQSYEVRRLLIDQGAKMVSSINEIVAADGGAIAAIWHSHWRERSYNYRVKHKDRDLHYYLIRGSWAQVAGLIKPDGYGYTDQITRPAEEVFCRCYYQYVYNLRQLPEDMLTVKGREALAQAKATREARMGIIA